MLVAAAHFIAAVHDFENVVTAVSDVSCNIVQLRYAVFFLGGGDRHRGRTIDRFLLSIDHNYVALSIQICITLDLYIAKYTNKKYKHTNIFS